MAAGAVARRSRWLAACRHVLQFATAAAGCAAMTVLERAHSDTPAAACAAPPPAALPCRCSAARWLFIDLIRCSRLATPAVAQLRWPGGGDCGSGGGTEPQGPCHATMSNWFQGCMAQLVISRLHRTACLPVQPSPAAAAAVAVAAAGTLVVRKGWRVLCAASTYTQHECLNALNASPPAALTGARLPAGLHHYVIP